MLARTEVETAMDQIDRVKVVRYDSSTPKCEGVELEMDHESGYDCTHNLAINHVQILGRANLIVWY